MKRLLLLSALVLLITPSSYGQTTPTEPGNDDNVELKRFLLIFDLQSLEVESKKLDKPLARALAKAEIADAAWLLDQDWAKKLLHQAYELTFPEEETRIKLRNKPVGLAPTILANVDIARNNIRNRVLQIASRDKAFLDELIKFSAQELGRQEEHYRYASLADHLLTAGETQNAGSYIMRAIEADPTILNAGIAIFDIAARDRKAADKLIIQYIERLRTVPLSQVNNSAWRTYLFLKDLVFTKNSSYLGFTNSSLDPKYQQIPPAGSDVLKAYASYIIESLAKLEQSEPGSAKRFRGFLLSAWLPLSRYAPELTGSFLALEKLSRTPGQDAPLPQSGDDNAGNAAYEKRVKDALDNPQPDDLTINLAIGRGDYAKARKMIEKISDGDQKAQLYESVNAQEAISLATNGDTTEAERLAQQLKRATSILQVYPVIINKCADRKDQLCASALVRQAIKQLKRANAEPSLPSNLKSIVLVGQESDPITLTLSRLAKAVFPVNETLALEVLEEAVQAANNSHLDTGQGLIGLEINIFKTLARNNEARARQAANNLTDRLRQIVALAAIYQWRAEEIIKRTKPD